MSADPQTIAVYQARATDYVRRFAAAEADASLEAFMAELAPGSRVLDLGCGPGTASAFLKAAGHRPDPIDAAPAMVAEDQRRGVPARLAGFSDIDARAAYDGVWANFSLLHAPRAELPRLLAALRAALVPGGILHIGMKTGAGEGRDALGRFYTYVGRDELAGLLAEAGFTLIFEAAGEEAGLAGPVEPYILMRARAG